jgi:hypothetical protein
MNPGPDGLAAAAKSSASEAKAAAEAAAQSAGTAAQSADEAAQSAVAAAKLAGDTPASKRDVTLALTAFAAIFAGLEA